MVNISAFHLLFKGLIKAVLGKPQNEAHKMLNTGRTSLAVQWLRLHFQASSAGGMGLILVWGTESPHASSMAEKKKEKVLTIG